MSSATQAPDPAVSARPEWPLSLVLELYPVCLTCGEVIARAEDAAPAPTQPHRAVHRDCPHFTNLQSQGGENMPDAAEQFDSWAIVEVMGHRVHAGRVTEQVIAGAAFVRIDIPETKARSGYSKLIGPSSIYAITPCSEEAARFNAERLEQYSQPIPYTPPLQIAAKSSAPDESAARDYGVDDDDDDSEDDDFEHDVDARDVHALG